MAYARSHRSDFEHPSTTQPDLWSLLHALAAAGRARPAFGFYDRRRDAFDVVPQATMARTALRLSHQLRSQGVGPGDLVVVDASSPKAQVVAFLAAVGAGAIPVVHPTRPALAGVGDPVRAVTDTVAVLGAPAHVLTNHRGERREALARTGIAVHAFGLDDTVVDLTEDPGPAAARPAPEDIAHLQLTSGSTGRPKVVAITHANVMVNCRASAAMLDMHPGDATVSWLPLYHDLGLVGMVLLGLYQGTDVYLLSPFDFLADPMAWLRAVSTVRGVLSASPSFGYELVTRRATDDDVASVDLSSWRLASVGAEPIAGRALRAFAERFAPAGFRAQAFQPCYGLAEATLSVTAKPWADEPRSALVPRAALAPGSRVSPTVVALTEARPSPGLVECVDVGTAVPGAAFEIVDVSTGERLGDGVVGEVVVRGESITPGSLDASARPGPPGSRTLATGDLGFALDGHLFVVERLKNIIIRRGENLPAAVLEDALAQALGVAGHGVMVTEADLHDPSAPLLAVVEASRGADPDELAVLGATAARGLGLPIDEVLVVGRGSLPLTTSGKKRHHELRLALNAGSLTLRGRAEVVPCAAEPEAGRAADTAAVERAVFELVAMAARRRGVDAPVLAMSHLAHDLGLDSVDVYEVVVSLERRLGVMLGEDDLAEVACVGDLVAVSARRVGGAGGRRGLSTLQSDALDQIPQLLRVVDRQEGRRLLTDGRWVVDFASLNYLGLDLHPTVQGAVAPMVAEWGTHPSWSRAVAAPAPYARLERELAELVGAPDALVFPSITLAHLGLLPLLVGAGGMLVIDRAAHHSLHEVADLVRGRGGRVAESRHNDLDDVARLLASNRARPAVVAIDSGYSMSGEVADIGAYLEVCERFDATLYVDGAHDIGVLGADPSPAAPYGSGGGGIVPHLGVAYDRLVYVSGLSKAFSSLAAFATCTGPLTRRIGEVASTLVFSGPIPVASMATALAGLEVNRTEGDHLRWRLWRLTKRLTDGARELGLLRGPHSGLPIVQVTLGDADTVIEACRVLWDHGVLVTPSTFPAVPLDEGGVRFSVTAANTDDEVDQALDALAAVERRLRSRR